MRYTTIDTKQVCNFLELQQALLTGGPFTLKDGSQSNFFFDCSRLCSGAALVSIGELLCDLLYNEPCNYPDDIDYIIGPAYKGISLATTTAMAIRNRRLKSFLSLPMHVLSKQSIQEYLKTASKPINMAYIRKEPKTHGEHSGSGSLISGIVDTNATYRIAIVDDVITTGQSKLDLIRQLNKILPKAEIVTMLVVLDRQHKIHGLTSAQWIEQTTGIECQSLIKWSDIETHLNHKAKLDR